MDRQFTDDQLLLIAVRIGLCPPGPAAEPLTLGCDSKPLTAPSVDPPRLIANVRD